MESVPKEVITTTMPEENQMEQINEKGDNLDVHAVESSMIVDESSDITEAGVNLVSREEQDKAGGQSSSTTSQLACMLDQIISDMKTSTKKISDQVLATKSIAITQATSSSPSKGKMNPKSTRPAKIRSSLSVHKVQKPSSSPRHTRKLSISPRYQDSWREGRLEDN